jgi:hypothetical protein
MDKLSQKLYDTDRRIRVSKDNEVLRIQRSIEKTMLTILDRVKLRDTRLSFNLLKVGSYYDGLKIGFPDEFDFLAEMVDMKEGKDFIVRSTGFNGTKNLWKCSEGQPGRRKIQYVGNHLHCTDSQEGENWMKEIGKKKEPEYLIDCISVKNTFYDNVLATFETLSQEDLPKYLQKGTVPTFLHGPAVTLEFIWNGRSLKNLTISVDITICMKVDNWRSCIDAFEWITDGSIIANTLRNTLDKDGFHLTPYISDKGHTCQWRVSTSYTEHVLMESFGYDSKLKIAIRCLKYERDKHVTKIPEASDMADLADIIQFARLYTAVDDEQQLVTSYMIKTTALVTLGLLTRKRYNRISLSVLYKYLTVRLYTSIKLGTLRMFFISDYKLRVPAFGEILPGFKSLVETIDEDVDTFPDNSADIEYSSDEVEFEFKYTNEMFIRIKRDIEIKYNFIWRNMYAF